MIMFMVDGTKASLGQLSSFCEDACASVHSYGVGGVRLQIDIDIDLNDCPCEDFQGWADTEATITLLSFENRHPEIFAAIIHGSLCCGEADETRAFAT